MGLADQHESDPGGQEGPRTTQVPLSAATSGSSRSIGDGRGPAQKVQVFSLGTPPKGTPTDRRRYRVKWRVDGIDRTRSLKTRVEADRLRTQLKEAAVAGLPFDRSTGLPEAWVSHQATWFEWSVTWIGHKWPRWAGNTRRSAVETLVALTPHLTRPGAPPAPADLGDHLRTVAYNPAASETALPWLERWSIPLDEITPAVIEATLDAATTRRDGRPMSATVARRRKNMLGSVLRSAVRHGLIDRNPMDRVEWRSPERDTTLDVSTVPSFVEVCRAVDLVARLESGGARYGALFAMVGMAGLRPSEVAGLDIGDLTLPAAGWGLAVVRGATTSPGARYTADGETWEDKGLKQRAADAVREVPLPPPLVAELRRHLERFPSNAKVFTNVDEKPVSPANYGPVWERARTKLWPGNHLLAATTVYDLRHAAATTMLRSGVMAAEVARRLGHSVDVLMRVYAGVLDDERDRSNSLIDAELARQLAEADDSSVTPEAATDRGDTPPANGRRRRGRTAAGDPT